MDAWLSQISSIASDENTLRQLVVWLSAISVFVLVIGTTLLALNIFDPVRRRVGALADDAPRDRRIMIKVASAIGPVAAFVLPQEDLERRKVMRQLMHAGLRSPVALQTFYFIKTILTMVLPLAVLLVANWIPHGNTSDILIFAMIAAGVGMLLPNFVLHKMEEKRMLALRRAFPDALDLLVVCVESGLGLAAAIQRVAKELDVSHPELAFELATVNAEIRVGIQRERALRNLADRTGLEDVRGLVGLLVQTMRFGTGVADALRIYSEEFRDKRTQKAEEQAAKMGTKLVFPLVLFMFPIFFIVAIGPAVIRIIDAFSTFN